MLNLNRKGLFDAQITVFVEWGKRKELGRYSSNEMWLKKFQTLNNNIKDVFDITEVDISRFYDTISSQESGQFFAVQAKRAIRMMQLFYGAREKNGNKKVPKE